MPVEPVREDIYVLVTFVESWAHGHRDVLQFAIAFPGAAYCQETRIIKLLLYQDGDANIYGASCSHPLNGACK